MSNGQSETCDKKGRANSVDMREDEKPDRNWRRSGELAFAALFPNDEARPRLASDNKFLIVDDGVISEGIGVTSGHKT